jgi:hypothetical protein
MAGYKVTKDGVVLPPIDRERFPLPSAAYLAETELDGDDRVVSVEIPEERIIPFDKPGKMVEHKRIYTVKGVKPDGTVVQMPLEDQINNNIASPENVVGLQFYVRKGFEAFYDFQTHQGVFCPTRDCWAKWNPKFDGFCCENHKLITKPGDPARGFGPGSTTTTSMRGI